MNILFDKRTNGRIVLTAIQDIDKQSQRTLVVEKISIFKAKKNTIRKAVKNIDRKKKEDKRTAYS